MLFLTCTYVSAQDTSNIISDIEQKVQALDQIINYKVITIEGGAFLDTAFLKQKNIGYGHLTAYFKNDTIYRIQEHIGIRLLQDVASTSYYYSGGNLIYVRESERYGPEVYVDSEGTVDYKAESPDFEGFYYFYNGKFIAKTKGEQHILPNEKFFDSQSKEGQLEYAAQKYFGMMNNKEFLSGVITHTKNVTVQLSELIVVFKKDIELQKAVEILNRSGVEYREGIDSSRGKQYFYSTGPKFIVTFNTEEEKEKFLSEYKNKEEIHEIYVPDWTIQKD